ncbi:MAG: BlaI/MecI/CopY family transcriptional regulator [Armatimonadota bacterium]
MDGGRSNRITGVGELQLEVLDILMELGEGTVYDVLDQFPEDERPRYNTVMTVLRTLEDKGLAQHRTEGRAFVFRPTGQGQRVRERVLRDVLDRVFGSSPLRLMSTLLNSDAVAPEEMEELRALLERQEVSEDDQ